MKQIIVSLELVIISLFFFLFSIGPALAAGATLSLSPASGTFNKGCNFSLSVIVNTGGVQTDGTDAILFYDPTRFLATKINNGTIYVDYPGNNIDTQNGKITVSGLSSVSSAFVGTGILATIDLKVLDNAPEGLTQIKFDFTRDSTTDSNVVERGTVSDVLSQVIDGNYTVGSGSCVAVSPTPGKALGGPDDADLTPTPLPTKTPVLPQSGSVETIVVLAIVGGILTILGILGLALL